MDVSTEDGDDVPRVFLRRVMANPDRPETTQPSEEDKRRTMISLTGGKTFGRAETNDVIFLDRSEIVEREPSYISRDHAEIIHDTSGKLEVFFVIDKSENGTYINDRRLKKNHKVALRVGDIVKFGHKNGATHKPGEYHENPSADFAFCTTLVHPGAPLYFLEKKNVQLRIHIGSPFVEEMDFKERTAGHERMIAKREGVQQQEADSTDGKFASDIEIHTNGSSTNGPSSSTPGASESSPSTSEPSTSMANGAQQNSTPPAAPTDQMPSTSAAATVILPLNAPTKAPHRQSFAENKLAASWTNCAARRHRAYTKQIQDQADRIIKAHPELSPLSDLLECLLDINVGKNYEASKEQKEDAIEQFWFYNQRTKGADEVRAQKGLIAENLMEEEPETEKIRKWIEDFQNRQEVKDPVRVLEQSEASAFEKLNTDPPSFANPKPEYSHHKEDDYLNYLKSIKQISDETKQTVKEMLHVVSPERLTDVPLKQEVMRYMCALGSLNKSRFNEKPQLYTHYLQQFSRVIDVVPVSRPTVISAFTKVVHPEPVAQEVHEVDEERHSASSGSTAAEEPEVQPPVFRRRTDSEESIDVVGGDEEKPKEKEKENEKEKELEEEKATETDTTPTPSPEDSIPRIDAQSASSAGVSALPTPLSSPIPKVTLASPPPPKPSASPTPAPPPATSSSSLNSPSTSSASVPAQTGSATSSNASVSSVGAKRKAAPKERRMKQLDESSGDSESDDNDKTPPKKKSIRRSVRANPATVPKKSAKKILENGPAASASASEDPVPTEDKTPVAARRKTLKRTASQIAMFKERKAKEKEEKAAAALAAALAAGDAEEPPKKKRGRKKVTPPPEDQDDEDEAVESEKEKCGVANKYCLCAKWEKRYTLEWVSCSTCEQWFHAFCVRMKNNTFKDEEVFICCGDEATEEARDCKNGTIHAKYYSQPPKDRKHPTTPEKAS